jgi:hypothetical protein
MFEFESLDYQIKNILKPQYQIMTVIDSIAIAQAILDIHRQNSLAYLKIPITTPNGKTSPTSDNILLSKYKFYGELKSVPPIGQFLLNWEFFGKTEWNFSFNQHNHLQTLLTAHLSTGKQEYLDRINVEILDWIHQHREISTFGRGIEISMRIKNWATIFYSLINILPAETLMEMLLSLYDQISVLKNTHKTKSNIAVTELSGLLFASIAFPSLCNFTKSDILSLLYTEIELTTGLDGVNNEGSVHYHYIIAKEWLSIIQTCRSHNIPFDQKIFYLVKSMWIYLLSVVNYNDVIPNIGDGDHKGILNDLILAKNIFELDSIYIGEKIFNHANEIVFKDGKNLYLHFKAKRGSKQHGHDDEFSIILENNGIPIFIDSGRHVYNTEESKYFIGPYAHNHIIVDTPIFNTEYTSHITDTYDIETCSRIIIPPAITYNNSISIKRILVHLEKENAFLVIDRVFSTTNEILSCNWNIHPDRHIILDKNCVDIFESRDIALESDTGPNTTLRPLFDTQLRHDLGKFATSYDKYRTCPKIVADFFVRGNREYILPWIIFLSGDGTCDIISENLNSFTIKVNSNKIKLNIA